MPNYAEEPLEKVTFNAFARDMDWLRGHHGGYGYGDVIRQLIRAYRQRVEKDMAASGTDDWGS